MPAKTFAIITDVHSNVASLETALGIIDARTDIDQKICLGDYFALGPSPKETLDIFMSIKNCIFIRGNHDRYLIERLWEQPHHAKAIRCSRLRELFPKDKSATNERQDGDPFAASILYTASWSLLHGKQFR